MTDTDHPIETVPMPDLSYGPERVVEIQLRALADNDEPVENAGIKTAYNFASPANRRATGPLPRFVAMVESHTYAPMIDHVEATTGPLERTDSQATQTVTLTGPHGQTTTYEFGVLRQQAGRWEGCWLTDRVLTDG